MGKLIFYIFLLSILIINCEKEMEVETPLHLPSQIAENFSMYETVSGRKKYHIKGEKAYYYAEEKRIHLKKVNITFYQGESPSSWVSCDSGIVDERTGNLLALKNVKVVTQDNSILLTDSLVWINRIGQICTDARVKIISKQGEIEGIGLVSDANLERIEIKESIRGTTRVKLDE